MKRDSKIRSNSSSSSSSYNTFKNEMKSTIDAAALQNNIAQKYSLPGSKLTIQVKKLFIYFLFISLFLNYLFLYFFILLFYSIFI